MIGLRDVGEENFSKRHELVLSVGVGGPEGVVLRPHLAKNDFRVENIDMAFTGNGMSLSSGLRFLASKLKVALKGPKCTKLHDKRS